MNSHLARSFLAVLPVLGISIAAGTATTAMASAATAPPASTAPGPAWLYSISCPSARFCMAVGNDAATEWWDGRHWHRLPTPNPGGDFGANLNAVSCPSAAECMAVGGVAGANSTSLPVAETWTRSGGWKIGQPAVPAGTYSELDGISCPSASVCYAAGGAILPTPAGTGELPLVERWTPRGGWVEVKLPTLPGATGNELYGISCTSATQCAAVGTYGLIEQLNGSTWSVSRAPDSTDGQLDAVSCPSASRCVAVGTRGIDHNLAERWSGGRWTAATPPSPPASQGVPGLNGVSCPSATHCVAGGDTLSKAFSGGFVDTLNGTTWTMTAQYGPRFKVSTLDAMSCFSASAMAVGCAAIGSTTGSTTDVPLSAFLTGSTWTIIPTV